MRIFLTLRSLQHVLQEAVVLHRPCQIRDVWGKASDLWCVKAIQDLADVFDHVRFNIAALMLLRGRALARR
jgi:hypothetical protein